MTVRIACLGVAAGVVSALIGGWDTAMETLCIAMLLDYASGLIVAGVFHKSPKSREGGLESKAALKGLLRKSLVVAAVIAFHQLDRSPGRAISVTARHGPSSRSRSSASLKMSA